MPLKFEDLSFEVSVVKSFFAGTEVGTFVGVGILVGVSVGEGVGVGVGKGVGVGVGVDVGPVIAIIDSDDQIDGELQFDV